MSDRTSEESSPETNTRSVESGNLVSSTVLSGLFERTDMDMVSPDIKGEVMFSCNVPYCNEDFDQENSINTLPLLNHYKTKHKQLLIEKVQEAIKSSKTKEDSILDARFLDSLRDTSSGITKFQKRARARPTCKRLSGRRKTGPSQEFCSPQRFKRLYTQSLIGANIPFDTCDSLHTKRMLDAGRFGLSNVITRESTMLELKQMYFKQVKRLRKEFKEHVGHFALTLNQWKVRSDNHFLGITVRFFNDSLELKRYSIGLEHIKKKGENAQFLVNILANVLRYYHIGDRVISISRGNSPLMTKVITSFEKGYFGKDIRDFDGDVMCFRDIADLTVKAFMAHAFSQKASYGDPMEEDTDAADDSNSTSHMHVDVKALPERIRKLTRSLNKNDELGALFDSEVAIRKHTDNRMLETLKNEDYTGWISKYEMISCVLYFKKQVIEVYKEVGRLSSKEKTRLAVTEITEPEWEHLETVRDILLHFVDHTKALEGSTYVTIHATIPSVHSLLEIFTTMNTECLRSIKPTISRGLAAAYDTLYEYYPIYEKTCGRLKILFIATVLSPEFKLRFFQNWEPFSRELIKSIEKELKNLFWLYEKRYEKKRLQNGEICDGLTRIDYQAITVKRKNDVFSYLSKYNRSMKKATEIEIYLREESESSDFMEYYQRKKESLPILFQLAKDIMAIPASAAPDESLFTISSDLGTNINSISCPAMTKMLAVVKDGVMSMKPGDEEPSEESSDEEIEIDDDQNLTDQFIKEIGDSGGDTKETDSDDANSG
ncbi:hypothetical protein OXX59_005525 [Metschnikowia pulcherrima]